MPDQIYPDRHIAHVRETYLYDDVVLSEESDPYISISRFRIASGVYQYSADSNIFMGRSAIHDVMKPDSGYESSSWQDITSGLRHLSRPNKKLRSLARVAGLDTHLDAIRQSSKELSDILLNNQDTRDVTVIVPVYSYADVRRAYDDIDNGDDAIVRDFVGFSTTARYFDHQLHGGNDIHEVYIAKADVPYGFDSDTSVRVSVGAGTVDKDKKSGMDRHRVRFSRLTPPEVTTPRLAWIRDHGDRHLIFPASLMTSEHIADVRPSPIIGAVLAEKALTRPSPYVKRLDDVFKNSAYRSYDTRFRARSFAGLLPLVLGTNESAILSSTYISRIESRLQ